MANLSIQKYLNKLLYFSAQFTDVSRLEPVIIYDGQGNVLTASGYVPANTIPNLRNVFPPVEDLTPVIIVDQDTNPYSPNTVIP